VHQQRDTVKVAKTRALRVHQADGVKRVRTT
jgi:hypothetical protein